MPRIYFTVTNDLSYDQRMIRICTSLSEAGYDIILTGRRLPTSVPLISQPFQQKRLFCFFTKGKLFYAEYNLRLFFWLLLKRMDGICAIDLDTIVPVLFISKLKNAKRIYDAHELFCEMKEIVSRPIIYKIWKWIERNTVPRFEHTYTVNQPLADMFEKLYGRPFKVIRSIAAYTPQAAVQEKEKFILYQGAVNEGRSFETLIPAMQWVKAPLYICGDGNFMKRAQKLAKAYAVEDKIKFFGMIPPAELKAYTTRSYIGLTLFEKNGMNNYFSLANRFFDYIQAGTPQICSDYPVYRNINNLHNVAVLIEDLSSASIAKVINELLANEQHWKILHENCLQAAKTLSWQEEEKKLIAFYKNIFG